MEPINLIFYSIFSSKTKIFRPIANAYFASYCYCLHPVAIPLDCDFENADLCTWVTNQSSLGTWTAHAGPTNTRNTGPDFDHTYGTAQGSPHERLSHDYEVYLVLFVYVMVQLKPFEIHFVQIVFFPSKTVSIHGTAHCQRKPQTLYI